MSWGFWKKLKRTASKIASGVKKAVDKVSTAITKAKPVIDKIDFKAINPKLGKLKDGFDVASDTLLNVNDKLQNNDVAGLINYAGHKFVPKFKTP